MVVEREEESGGANLAMRKGETKKSRVEMKAMRPRGMAHFRDI